MAALDPRFRQILKSLKIEADMPVAIACSGGPDSMALTLLAQGVFKKIVALTVDHGLRKESAKEAVQVGKWLKSRSIAHVILPWKGRKPGRNIQEAARKARYQLMAEYCRRHGITTLLVAHHLEDQAETFLLRLARGSGVDGLAAMAMSAPMYDVTLLRPLLGIYKSELLDYLKKRKQAYVNDPSNENPAFDRVKIRKLLPALAEVGLTADRLAKTAANMARARAHLEEQTGHFLKNACGIFPEGYARLMHLNVSEEIALRALATLIMIIGGNDVKTRMSELMRLNAALKAADFRGATLGGCVFMQQKDAILIYRELRSVASSRAVKADIPAMWDNRFEIRLAAPARLRAGALSQKGWLWLAKTQKLKSTCPNKNILYSLPALRDLRGRILAVPQLGFFAGQVRCEAVFKAAPALETRKITLD